MIKFLYICLMFNLIFMNNFRDCPENFILNPQYPSIEPECLPEQFVYYSSVNLAFYLFNEVTINDYMIDSEDWVGAFNGNICVGARQWGSCGENNTCDVPVLGNDQSGFTEGYMSNGLYPTFKIYDVSENIYIDAISTENIAWYNLISPIIDLLYSYYDIYGCTDQYACNLDPFANINDGSCEYCSCSLNSDIIFNNDLDNNGVIDNYQSYANNGSITARIFHGNDEIGASGDVVAAFVNDEIRGMGLAAEAPEFLGGGYVFSIMIYSNESSGETLTFKYYQSITDNMFCLNESIEFQSDMIIGDAINSFNLIIPDDWLSTIPEFPDFFKITAAYPNPFNPEINIDYLVNNQSNITFYFYDIKGRLLETINSGFLYPGNYTLTWKPEFIPSGQYFIVISDGNQFYKEKITLIK